MPLLAGGGLGNRALPGGSVSLPLHCCPFCDTLLGRILRSQKKNQTPRERFVKKELAAVMSHAALREEVATKVARALESSRDEVLADRIIKRAVEFPQTDFPKWREGKEPKARRS